MSVNLMSAIFETEFFDLTDEEGNVTKAATAKLVLLAMADHANDEGEGSYPSVERLCRKTALSPQTIRNTFDALRHNGIIFLEGISKHGTNNHTINTKSFPKAKGKEVTVLTLYPLDPSNGSLLTPLMGNQTPLPVRPESSLTINEPSNGVPPNYSVEWQVAGGNQTVVIPDEMDAKMKDAANLISTGLGSSAELGYSIAMAFMQTRKILFTESQIKGQRKAIKALIEAKVYPKHVRDAVEKLVNDGMTVTDLYSVTKTAISLANPTPESTGYNPQGLSIS